MAVPDMTHEGSAEGNDSLMRIEGKIESIIPKNINWNVVLLAYAVILLALNFSRLFYDNFWGDECYTIMLSRGSYENLMYMTEYHDNHPPLHYLYFKAMCDIFGQNYFVYNATSYVPYLLMIILSVTFVRKNFGIQVAAVVVTLASIIWPSLYYITEARQYELALVLLFVMFLVFYKILENPRPRYFVILTIVYTMVCYTHYYAMVAGGLMYFAYGVHCLVDKDGTSFRYTAISLAAAALAFLPWVQFFFVEADRLSQGFWLNGMPNPVDDILWFFGDNPVYLIYFLFLFITLLYIPYRAGFLKDKNGWFDKLYTFIDLGEVRWRWVIMGTFAVYFLIIFMTVFSLFYHPLISLRYIYPLSAIVWLTFAVFIPGCKAKKAMTVLVMAVILIPGAYDCYDTMRYDYEWNQDIMETMDLTRAHMEKGDTIISDVYMFAGNECRYYYGIEPENCGPYEVVNYLSEDHQNWIFLWSPMGDDVKSLIESNGYTVELIQERGRVGNNVMSIYKATLAV